MRFMLVVLCALFGAAVSAAPAAARVPYALQPDLHGDRIVFVAESDLWSVAASGGLAQRLTSDEGSESFPRFSPDGRWIAFSAQYDGNQDVFVVAATGGEPRRLTWHPGADQVVEWTPDGKEIVFRSMRASGPGEWELFRIPVEGGEVTQLPLGWAARIDMDPASGLWAFNRAALETATWKRYRGGAAAQLWVGHPDRADYRMVSSFDGNHFFPMWIEGRIYHLADKGGTMNVWSMKPDGSDWKRHTEFAEWDARWAAKGDQGRIAFVMGGDVHVFTAADNTARKVEIELPSERALTRNRYPNAGQYLTTFSLSPEGDRLAVVARGEIFSVPVKDGVTLPVTRGSGARESYAEFSPDGKTLYFVSDASREEAIHSMDAWGRGEAKVVKPAGKDGWHFPPVPSPDGTWLAFSDQTQTLYVMPASGGAAKTVDRSVQSEIRQYVWSPDGRWLAYTKNVPTDYGSIHVYDTKEGVSRAVTGPTTADAWPAWDPDGRYLYFISNRAVNPFLGGRDWDDLDLKADKVYLVTLRKDVKNPLLDAEGLPPAGEDAGKKDSGKDEEKKDDAPKPVEIDFDGIADRVVELPVPHGNYFGMAATSGKVFYASVPVKGFAEQPGLFDEPGPENTLMAFDWEKKEASPFLEGISAFSLAAKGEKIAVMKQKGEIYVVGTAAPPGPDLGESKVDMSDLVIDLDPREEWEQIYYEGWRHERDFYWDPELAKLDWMRIRDQYAAMLPRIGTRAELQDLLGELIGELNNSHTYVWGGDYNVKPNFVATGLLGCETAREGNAFRVTRVYRGDPADNARSPLSEPGVGVKEGDYIQAVNHRPFAAGQPFLAAFAARAGKEVVLTVSDRASGGTTRDVVVVPVGNDGDLRYSDWVRRNREYVAEKTGGKIGYIHIPDMWQAGMIEFNTWFYPQLDKEGMIVDVRWNGGGAVSQIILERFRRHVLSWDRTRAGAVTTYPYRLVNGPFVVLTNEFAGSDGDIFPMAVQLEGLAPVIGARSWGGVVGIRGDKSLVDGGLLTQPEFAWWDARQGWDLENRGVIPDIPVQNLPQELASGKDAQLDRAIEEVLQRHRENPPARPEFGPVRERSREAFFRREMGN